MPSSPARIAANRRNALLSTGPRTEAGKLASRGNALKHGLTGEGVVLPDEDAAEVDRRFAEFQDELRPRGGVGRFLARRAAMLSVRLDRSARHEAAETARRMRNASERFEHERLAEVDHAHSWIGAEPATHGRKLRSMPEGVDRLVASLLELREELDERGASRWDWHHGDRLSTLLGRRFLDIPVTRIRALSEAVAGKFEHLGADEGAGLGERDRRTWARDRLVAILDEEVQALRDHRKALDPAIVEEDRAGAPARALFDPSKDAILARKYEAAAERNFFRTLREIRELEAAPAPEAPPEPAEPSDPGEGAEVEVEVGPEGRPEGSVGSFFPTSAGPIHPPACPPPTPPGGPPVDPDWIRIRSGLLVP